MRRAKFTSAIAAMLLVFAALFAGGCSAADSANSSAVSSSGNATASSSSATAKSTSVAASSSVLQDSSFKVTFIDVGQGDAAVVSCDGHNMIIDGGTPEASQTMYTWCKKNNITEADYVVATHPDSDHAGGLCGALQVATAKRAFCSTTDDTGKAYQSMERTLNSQGVSVEVPAAGDTFSLGSATVQVVGPTRPAPDGEDNNNSLVLRVSYGDTSFLFAGDAMEDEERDVTDSGYELDSTVLKVGHHGSSGSSTTSFLRAVSPQYAVISVGKNSYGHQTESALARLKNRGAEIFRTDLQGDITMASDGEAVQIAVDKNVEANTGESALRALQASTADGAYYIGNLSSHKFHASACRGLPKEGNRVYFNSRDEAISAGYDPCGICKP